MLLRRSSESEHSEGEVDNEENWAFSDEIQLSGTTATNDKTSNFNTWCSNNHADVRNNDLNEICDTNRTQKYENDFTMECVNDNDSYNEINQNTPTNNFIRMKGRGRTSRGRPRKNRGPKKAK